MIEKRAHQSGEKIPGSVVHAKGRGAHGTFTVTHDITKYTKAKIFSEVGKKSRMIARFSTVSGELGAADAERDVRGFALTFYTEEGNDDYIQPRALFSLFDKDQKERLFSNIADALQGVPDNILERQLGHFEKVHPDYAAGVRAALDKTSKVA